MTPKALFQYFLTEFGKYQLTSLATGTTSLMLSSNDIQSMKVPGFETSQLEMLGVAHDQITEKFVQIEALRTEIENANKTTFEAITSWTLFKRFSTESKYLQAWQPPVGQIR